MNSDKWYSNRSQVFWTCKALLDGRTISHRTEIREMRGWRLGAVVHRLKSEFGWPIQTEYRRPENIAFYSLEAKADRASLCYPRSARDLDPNGGDA